MDSNNLGVGQQPNLAGIDYSELVLIHATPRKPTINERGNVEIFSAFQNAGALIRKPTVLKLRGGSRWVLQLAHQFTLLSKILLAITPMVLSRGESLPFTLR